MTTVTRNTATNILTIWNAGPADEFGRRQFLAPFTVRCAIARTRGSKEYTDSKGVKFTPAIIAHYEQSGQIPLDGSYIAQGVHVMNPSPLSVQNAMPVKAVIIHDGSFFGELDDIELMA